jgi:hypothetical protein
VQADTSTGSTNTTVNSSSSNQTQNGQSGIISVYGDPFVPVRGYVGVQPVGGYENMTLARDLPPLPTELAPNFINGSDGFGVPYRDQAGQVWYRTFDSTGAEKGWVTVAEESPTQSFSSAAAPLIFGALQAEARSGYMPLMIAGATTLLAVDVAIYLRDHGYFSAALDPEQVRDDQKPPINVPVSPGPAGTPGQVADNRDTSTPGYEATSRPQDASTTTPIVEQSWRDLIVYAGGNWNTINESTSVDVVQQSTPTSCGPACAEMLLADRGVHADQSTFGDSLTSAQGLASKLNSVDSGWIGAGVDASSLRALTNTGSWSAMMWEPGSSIGHWVVVNGMSEAGLVQISDPFGATRYEMTQADFIKFWSGFSVFKP